MEPPNAKQLCSCNPASPRSANLRGTKLWFQQASIEHYNQSTNMSNKNMCCETWARTLPSYTVLCRTSPSVPEARRAWKIARSWSHKSSNRSAQLVLPKIKALRRLRASCIASKCHKGYQVNVRKKDPQTKRTPKIRCRQDTPTEWHV